MPQMPHSAQCTIGAGARLQQADMAEVRFPRILAPTSQREAASTSRRLAAVGLRQCGLSSRSCYWSVLLSS